MQLTANSLGVASPDPTMVGRSIRGPLIHTIYTFMLQNAFKDASGACPDSRGKERKKTCT